MTTNLSTKRKIFLLDNYDSFTYNLYDYLITEGAEVLVARNDAISLQEIESFNPVGIVLSPGPKRPSDAGILMEVISYFHDKVPLLGICLGHQGIGEFFGAELIEAAYPMHGKTSLIQHHRKGIFKEIPSPVQVMRYHSLILKSLEGTPLLATASTTSGEIMAFRHERLPINGLQFHPESILTENGRKMIKNWLYHLKHFNTNISKRDWSNLDLVGR